METKVGAVIYLPNPLQTKMSLSTELLKSCTVDTFDTWAVEFFVVGGCFVHCRILNSIYLLDATDMPYPTPSPPSCDNQNVSTHCQMFPEGQNHPAVNHKGNLSEIWNTCGSCSLAQRGAYHEHRDAWRAHMPGNHR